MGSESGPQGDVLERIEAAVVDLVVNTGPQTTHVPGAVVGPELVAAHRRGAAGLPKAETDTAVHHPRGPWTGQLQQLSSKWSACGVAVPGLALAPAEVRPSRTLSEGEALHVAFRDQGALRTVPFRIEATQAAKGGGEGLRPYEPGTLAVGLVREDVPAGALVFDAQGRLAGFVDACLGGGDGEGVVFALPGEWLSAMGPLQWLSSLFQGGELEQLVEEFARSHQHTRDARICCLAAEALVKLGRPREALPALRRALVLEPDIPWARETLAELERGL